MAIAVEMPKMSDTMEEGVLVAWLADEGDAVSAGDVVAQVETDKATMDLEVYDDGVLLKRVVEEGASVPIGGLIAVLGKEGEDVSSVLDEYGGGSGNGAAGDGAATPQPTAPTEGPKAEDTSVPQPEPVEEGDSRVKASPLARRMAAEAGISLSAIRGSGPEGRIVRRDVEAARDGDAPKVEPPKPEAQPAEAPKAEDKPASKSPETRPPSAPSSDAYESRPITQMRKTIARRLAESKFTAPHFYLTIEVDMARAIAVRKDLNAMAEAQGRAKVSFNDLVTKACAAALRRHPAVNSSYLEKEGEIRVHGEVHVAIAVAVEEGLLTPVIRHADRKGLAQIAEETRALAGKARDKQLQPQDWEGSTFTTSNLGMFGIQEFTAIINPPNACILAIGAIREVPVVKDGALAVGQRMTVSLSCDHRVVDGATGAAFLADVKQYLEEPMNLLL